MNKIEAKKNKLLKKYYLDKEKLNDNTTVISIIQRIIG